MPAAHGAVPRRLSPKRRQDGPKGSSARSSRSPSSPSPRRSASPHQNGHKGSAQNGRHSHGAPLPEPSDVRRLFLDHRSLPSPPPSAGPPHPGSPLPSFPARSAPPLPGWDTRGRCGVQGCTPCPPPPAPAPTFHWVRSLPGGASPSPWGRYRGSQQVIPPPKPHMALQMSPPPGTMAWQASVTCQGHHRAQHLPGRGLSPDSQETGKAGKFSIPCQPQPSPAPRCQPQHSGPQHPVWARVGFGRGLVLGAHLLGTQGPRDG